MPTPGASRTVDDGNSFGLADIVGAPDGDEPDDRGEASPGPARRRRPGKTLTFLIVGALGVCAGGLGASLLVKSPAERAAETGPPARGILTAAVERRVVHDTVVLQGEVVSGQQTTVSPQAGTEGSSPIITRVRVKVGESVKAGAVLVDVSARPVIALPGSIPIYRDLKPGDSGTDIEQLQSSLRGLGYAVRGDSAGYFGSGTKAAVQRLYSRLGYDVRLAGGADNQTLSAAEDAYRQAVRAYDQAVAGTGTPLPSGGAATAPGGQAGAGSSSAAAANAASATARAQQVRYAREDRDRALLALTKARQKAGPMVPASEVIFLRTLPARVVSLNAPLGRAVTTDMLVLSSGPLRVKAKLLPYQRGRVKAGQKVQLVSDDTGQRYPGVVAAVGSIPVTDSGGAAATGGTGSTSGQSSGSGDGSNGEQAQLYYPVTIDATKPIAAGLRGLPVRITVAKSTSAGAVLAVPSSAVSSRADGTTVVTIRTSTGALNTVAVMAGASGDGYVEVSSPAISAGDAVVVGR